MYIHKNCFNTFKTRICITKKKKFSYCVIKVNQGLIKITYHPDTAKMYKILLVIFTTTNEYRSVEINGT